MNMNLLTALWAHGSEHHAEPTAAAVAKVVSQDIVTLHPMLVHLPIGLLIAAIVFELICLVRKNPQFRFASRSAFILGSMCAVLALGSGFLADNELGHGYAGHDLAHTHRNIMIIATSIWLVAALGLWKFQALFEKSQVIHAAIYALIAAIFFFGAHIGGELVYEHGVGVKVMSEKPNKSHH